MFYANVDDADVEKCREMQKMKNFQLAKLTKTCLKMINGVHAMALNGGKKILGFLRIFIKVVVVDSLSNACNVI